MESRYFFHVKCTALSQNRSENDLTVILTSYHMVWLDEEQDVADEGKEGRAAKKKMITGPSSHNPTAFLSNLNYCKFFLFWYNKMFLVKQASNG